MTQRHQRIGADGHAVYDCSEVTTLKFDKGWVTEASVEDVKLLPGVSRQMFRLEGGDWVAARW